MPDDLESLIDAARNGDRRARVELFEMHRDQLRRLINARLNPLLAKRFDASDIIQDAYLDYSNGLDTWLGNPKSSFFVWLRTVVGNRLSMLHRAHLLTGKRDTRLEVSIDRPPPPAASSAVMADWLARSTTSPSNELIRAETIEQIREALEQLDEIDREILCMRHFEMLSNQESAEILGLSPTAASNRFVRAIQRISVILNRLDQQH